MSILNWRTLTATAIASAAVFTFTAGAQARDDDRWDRKDHRYYDHHRHGGNDWHRYDRPRVVERPVYVMPQPMYQVPVDSGVNLNFTIPLR